MLLTCCQSAAKKIYVPELTFPPFPVLEGYERTDGKVIVPEEWITSLAEYRIRIEETERNYREIKALYESGKAEE